MTRNETERPDARVSSGPVPVTTASCLDDLSATALRADPPPEPRRRLGSASPLIADEVERLGTYLKSLPERLSELGLGWQLGDAGLAVSTSGGSQGLSAQATSRSRLTGK